VLYAQPFYQKGVVPTQISEYNGKTPMRAVPDVAMPADPNTGLRIGETQQFPDGTYYATYRLGGTSLSSPLFAGVVADAVQYNGSAIGFINPLLYRDSTSSAITDVTAPATPEATVRTNLTNPAVKTSPLTWLLQTIDVPTTIYSAPGYDDQTGVGTPNGTFFLKAMKY
jgi:subtilase family serine protease